MSTNHDGPIRIQIWASGSGSNAENLIQFFRNDPESGIEAHSVMTDNPSAGVIDRCTRLKIPCFITNSETRRSDKYLPELKKYGIQYLVLAGYLKKVAPAIIREFPNRIINVHPSLLPKFGGKGMHGDHVHQAVLEAGESKTGITIHLVDEEYDRGPHLAQFEVAVSDSDNLEVIKKKISELEMSNFPKIVKKFIVGTNN